MISKHIPILDGIRAFAVLIVCCVHFFQVDEASLYENYKFLGIVLFKISQIGLKGVELFFLLSGFLITGILIESKNSLNFFTSFYARRFVRIFPLYYFVLTVCFFVLPRLVNIDESGEAIIFNQIWLWSYFSNMSVYFGFGAWDKSLSFPSFGHFWSLSVEEHFYVFWPFLIYFSSIKWLPRLMWLIVCFSSFSVLFVYFIQDMTSILNWSTIRCAGILSLGGLIAWYKNNSHVWERIKNLSSTMIIPAGIIFFLVNFIPRHYDILHVSTHFASIIFFASLLILALNDNKIINNVFNHDWLFFIGRISYGIYVYHGLLRPYFKTYIYENLIITFKTGIILSFAYTIICTILSVFIAYFSWILIENPFLKLKKYFNY